MIFLFFTSPLAPLEAEICPIEVWYGIAVVSSDRSSLRDDALNRYKSFSDHTLALHNHFTSESESERFSLIYRD